MFQECCDNKPLLSTKGSVGSWIDFSWGRKEDLKAESESFISGGYVIDKQRHLL